MAAKKKGKKAPTPARVAAMKAVEDAKSPQEKLVANGALKALRFTEIVVPRVKRTLKMLDMLQKMGRASNYKWTQEQGAKIAKAIGAKAATVVDTYTGKEAAPDTFDL